MTIFNAQLGPWLTPGIEDRLIAMHGEGLSFREIAHALSAEFGIELTKNAVAGRVHRLCLPLRIRPKHDPEAARARRRERDARARNRHASPVMRAPEAPVDAPDPSDGVDIIDLQLRDCRFPFGAFPQIRYCGKPQFHRSYCREHFKVAYFMPRVRWGT